MATTTTASTLVAATATVQFASNPKAGGTAAEASMAVLGAPSDDSTFALTDAENNTAFYVVVGGVTTVDGSTQSVNGINHVTIGISGASTNTARAERIRDAINNTTGYSNGYTLNITATASSGTVTLTQDTVGSAGNTTSITSSLNNVTFTDFAGGADIPTITIISTDGTSKEYKTGGSSSFGSQQFKSDGTFPDVAAQLKLAIEHASGHNGKITVANDGLGKLTLTQATGGVAGHTAVTINSTMNNTTVTDFAGGRGSSTPNQGAAVLSVQDAGYNTSTGSSAVVYESSIPVQYSPRDYSESFDDYGLRRKTIDIGVWNMDTTASVTVAHGLGDLYKNIRDVSVVIKNDADAAYYTDSHDTSADADAGLEIDSIGSTNITLKRAGSGTFDSASFSSTASSRGAVTIWYE